MKIFKTKFKQICLSHFAFSLGAPALIWQVIFFYIPLLFLLFSSLIKISSLGVIEGLTFEKWTMFLSPIYLRVIGSSFLLALSNSILCLLIAYPLAYYIAFKGGKWKNFLLFLLIVPFWTNFLLHVYAWFFVLDHQGVLNTLLLSLGIIHKPLHLLNTPFAIMVMMVYYYLPFMVLPLYSSLERLDMRLIEASFDLGASFWQTFRRIILPLTMRGLRTGFFLVYIPSFGEFAIPELMGGDRQMFVGSVVSHYILGESTGGLGTAFTAVACFMLMLSALFFYWLFNYLFGARKSHG